MDINKIKKMLQSGKPNTILNGIWTGIPAPTPSSTVTQNVGSPLVGNIVTHKPNQQATTVYQDSQKSYRDRSQEMRDIVFEEIIKITKSQGGTISAEELTQYWEAAKIIDKLRGI